MAGSIAVSRIQLGDHATATNNFVVKIPSTPNGSVVIANGNVGSEVDRIVVHADGRLGIGNAVNAGEAIRAAQVQSQSVTAFTTGGTATAYTLAPTPAITAYAAGQSFFVTFALASGASPTIVISGLATMPLVKQLAGGTYVNIAAGDIAQWHGSRVTLINTNGAAPVRALVETMRSGIRSAAKITQDNSQSIPHGTFTQIIYNTSVYDTLSELDVNGRFTAKNAGVYLVTASALSNNYAWDAGKQWTLALYKNGTLDTYGTRHVFIVAAPFYYAQSELSTGIQLIVGDFIDIRMFHTQGGAVALNPGHSWNQFTVHGIS